MPEVVVRALRGEQVETEHRTAWVVWGHDRVTARGGPRLGTFLRSSSKPFQALVGVRSGALERFGLDDRHLAMACSSHGGRPEHIALVREVLAACGLDETALQMGPDDPRDPEQAAALRERGEPPERITHNCSGKHALALAACVAQGWDVETYLDPGHPLQRAMHTEVARALAIAPEALDNATDGCGMQTHFAPLEAVARAFGRLAGGALGPEGDRVAAAMRANPRLVAFPGAIDTELMAGVRGVVAKVGAEGLVGIGLPDGTGAAVKVMDGSLRALEPATVAVAGSVLGLPVDAPGLRACARPDLRNSRGEQVGWLEARFGG